MLADIFIEPLLLSLELSAGRRAQGDDGRMITHIPSSSVGLVKSVSVKPIGISFLGGTKDHPEILSLFFLVA